MDTFFIIAIICGIIGICFCKIMIDKINITGENYEIIINAIGLYMKEQLNRGNLIDIDDLYLKIQPFNKTLYRLWDYGYENIVPKDVLSKIRPYINETDYNKLRS